ncbi:MAG TPA: lipopolysaccharide biosynthesis protein [Rhodocyclaceae bacterium]|nr:lipopolysaccharide biosynthesis protein [Rhodocyclaceae bacterium]
MSLRASVAYISVRAVSGVLSVCALSLFVRGLGAEQYAHFVLGMAAAALASTVLMIPLNTTLARLYGEVDSRPRVLATLQGTVLGLGITLTILALLLEWLGVSWLTSWALPAAALFAAVQGLLDFSAQRANSALEARRYGYLLLTKAICVIAFGSIAIMYSASAAAVLLAMALACAVSITVNTKGRFYVHGFDAALVPRVASFAMPLVVTCSLSYLLQWGDRYLLMCYVPLADLGRYSALADLTQQTLVLICSGLGAAWYPRIVQAWGAGQPDEARRLLWRYALIGISLVVPAAVGFALLLAPAAGLLFGQTYAGVPSSFPLLLVVASVVGGSKSFYFDVPMLLAERVWRLAAGIALSAFVSLAVMVWAVPQYGISGAAMGLLCGQLVGLFYSFAMGRDVLPHQLPVGQFLSVVAASASMGAVLWVWQPAGAMGLALRFVIGVFVYGFVLLALDFDEVRARLRSALKVSQ